MPKKPKISVIVPALNEQNNIKRLLQSIRAQTYKNHESIVVDDESTDATYKIAKKYADKAYRRKHAERSVQRNYGASKAKGECLLFLDADMELTPKVLEDCVNIINKRSYKAIVIPEKTVGEGFSSKIRKFEREMYMGDLSVEVARLFKKEVFNEVGGYDINLTGPEDYDLPYRISKKYKIGRSRQYILHHEAEVTFLKLLKKKYYYAQMGANYAQKHPELVKIQGNLLFRKAYLRNWKKFLAHPITGTQFLFVRIFETMAAILGYINAVGIGEFIKTFYRSFLKS